MKKRTVAAVAIHLYTASGAIFGFWSLAAIAEKRFSDAFLLLLIAFVVDYTDGTVARWLNVGKVLPLIDGGTLDHVVDFLTSAVLPVFIMWQAAVLPAPRSFWMTIVLFSALFRFSKTFNPWLSRGFFSGIPSPWINLAFYAVYYDMDRFLFMIIIIVMIFLTFLPVGYIHVARYPRWRLANIIALSCWWMIYLSIIEGWVQDERVWLHFSLVFPAFYLGSSWWFAVRSRFYATASSAEGRKNAEL